MSGAPPDGDRYWVRVLGDPGGDEPWGWRINGHHLAVHAIVVGDTTTLTPHFIGSEPAVIPPGRTPAAACSAPRRTWRAELAAGLDPDQRTLGISADVAPDDILTRHDPVADPSLLPERDRPGACSRPDQQQLLDRLVRRYLDRAPASYADRCWRDAEEAGPRPDHGSPGPAPPSAPPATGTTTASPRPTS